MADTSMKGTLFNPELVTDLFNKVRGKSSLAQLCAQTPIAFNGNEIFTFSMDDEIALVGEGEAKEAGHMEIAPIKIVPVKVEYGHRVTDEFLYATEEKKIDILSAFNDGFAAKLARGIDIMGIHGLNPRTAAASTLITQYLGQCENTVAYDAETADDCVETAVGLLGDYDITGIIMAKSMAADMAKIKANNVKQYPELAWGGQPNAINGVPASINTTVSFNGSGLKAVVGDFSLFKWGFAQNIPLEVIPYGDPDNTGKDLKGYNQCYLRAEAYIGWGILDLNAFALVTDEAEG